MCNTCACRALDNNDDDDTNNNNDNTDDNKNVVVDFISHDLKTEATLSFRL